MHISKEHTRALRVQLLLAALLTAVLLGLFLLSRGGRSATLYWVLLPLCLFFTPGAWLQDVKAVWLEWWDMDRRETRRLLLTALAAAACFTAAAHMFAFANEFLNHDSLSEIGYPKTGADWPWLSVGRPLLPLFDALSGTASAPWLLGLLFLLWLFLASVLAIRILHIHGTAARALLCGLLCTNVCLAGLPAHYTFCVSNYALSLLAALAGAWLFCRCRRGGVLGVYCIAFSMLLYQAYFIAAVAFCFFAAVRMLARGEKARTVLLRGVRYLALLAAGFFLYYLSWSALCSIYGEQKVRMGDLTLSHGFPAFLKAFAGSFSHFFSIQLSPEHPMGRLVPAVRLLVMAVILIWLLGWLMDRELPRSNKILLALSVCLLPAVLDLSYTFFSVMYNLTLVSVNLGFLGVFMLLCLTCPAPAAPMRRRWQAAALALAAALSWQNIVYSNEIYMKMELNKASTLSLFTRVVERIEQTEGYIPGETPVAFSGMLPTNQLLAHGRKGYEWATGYYTGAAAYDYADTWTTQYYIQDYLNYPMNITAPPEAEELAGMPAFPLRGSIQWIDGVLVVKLS